MRLSTRSELVNSCICIIKCPSVHIIGRKSQSVFSDFVTSAFCLPDA